MGNNTEWKKSDQNNRSFLAERFTRLEKSQTQNFETLRVQWYGT